MSKVKMIALKAFSNRGTESISEGQEFEVDTGMVRDYLISNLARVADGVTASVESDDISHMKVAQLREVAVSKGLVNAYEMTKQEILTALKND